MGEHALLSASGSHKWLNCPGSARLEAEYEDPQTSYSKEGSLAHSIGELKLQKLFTRMNKSTYTRRLNKLKQQEMYQAEMEHCTDVYRDYVQEIAMSYEAEPYVEVERKLDYSEYAPEGFGTADCIVVGENTLHVVDYKHGKGVEVSAGNNPQMMLYAIGAIKEFDWIYDVKTVILHIVQPRRENISRWETTAKSLQEWGENTVKPAAQKAFDGVSEYVPGEYCSKSFCKARHSCRYRAKPYEAMQDFQGVFPTSLSPSEISRYLKMTEGLEKWASELREYAKKKILEGVAIPAFKVVEGSSRRTFRDVDTAIEILKKHQYDEAMLYERKPLTLAQMEKVVGKAEFMQLLADEIVKPTGKPTLVLESDQRKPFQSTTAMQDFAQII